MVHTQKMFNNRDFWGDIPHTFGLGDASPGGSCNFKF